MRRVGIMLSTNDPDNGNDTGRVTAITALDDHGDTALDLVADYDSPSKEGIVCRVVNTNPQNLRYDTLILGRRKFPIHKHIDWYGNCCWRLVTVDIRTANAIFRYLHSMGKWNSEGGLTKFYEMWGKP